jgi:FdhD protein
MEKQDEFHRMLTTTPALHYLPGGVKSIDLELIQEEPLAINIQGKTYATIMRTPGAERAHAAGFCFAEGIVDRPGDLLDIALCDGEYSNVAAVMLTPERYKQVGSMLGGRERMSQTSCGICGREIVEDLGKLLTPVESTFTVSFAASMEAVFQLKSVQKLRKRCFSSHAVAILNNRLEQISTAEDAGRHNALDKSIGRLFLDGRLSQASIAILSSRASYEMIQKSARGGIEIVISMARPTALALDLANQLNMTLASVREEGLYVYSGRKRLQGQPCFLQET